jgi:dTDP-glucose 4,6-dehydratase
MNILVTGGYGFIGSNFINYIAKNESVKRIVNVDCATYAADKNNLIENKKIINYQWDINETEQIKTLLNDFNITHIVHFAAESHVDNSIKSPNSFIKTNINGTFSLLEAARDYGKLERFHHVSTDEVYGSLGSIGYFKENTPYDPRSPYSASKAASDHLVNAYHHTFGLNTTISNCSNNYGPNQHIEKLIPKIITNLYNDKKIPIYGSGVNIRDWLYVDDHCEAIWLILNKGKNGETYNVGGDTEKSNLSIAKTLCNLMEKNPDQYIEYVEDRKGHDFRYAIDFCKINNELNWLPKTNFIDGLKKTIDFYNKRN